MIRHCWSLVFLAISNPIVARTVPEGGRNVLAQDWQQSAVFQGSRKLAKATAADFDNARRGWRVEVLDDQAKPSQLQLSTPVERAVKSGDNLLLVFDARCLAESSADGLGRGQVMVEIKEPPKDPKLGQDVFEVGAQWQTIFIAFPAKVADVAQNRVTVQQPAGYDASDHELLFRAPEMPPQAMMRPCTRRVDKAASRDSPPTLSK